MTVVTRAVLASPAPTTRTADFDPLIVFALLVQDVSPHGLRSVVFYSSEYEMTCDQIIS
jgi:hypothetical protein